MKIVIATGPLLPVPAVLGGAAHRFWQQVAPEFRRMGHDVEVWAKCFPAQPVAEQIDGVRYQRFSGFVQSRLLAWDVVRDALYAFRLARRLPDADVLISNDLMLPFFAASRPNCGKLIIALGRQPKGQLSWYRRIDGIAATSNSVADSIGRQAPGLLSKVVILPCAIDVDVFKLDHGINRTKHSLLFAGRIHPEKGLDLLLQAFRIATGTLPTLQLTVIGPWREEQGGAGAQYRNRLMAEARGLNVLWLEPEFDVRQLAKHYQSTELFCYPSLAESGETLGIAPLEAMACGAVPIVSDLSCFRDYLRHGENGFVFDHRAPDAATRLSMAICTAFGTRLPAGAVNMAAQDYALTRVAARWIDALQAWCDSR